MKNIKKTKIIILFISFFVLISFAQQVFAQADVNLVLGSNITNQIIRRTAPYCNVFSYGPDWINIPSRINDNISNVPAFGGGSFQNNYYEFKTYADWTTPAIVNKIEVVFRGIATPGFNQMEAWIYRDATGWVKVGGVDMYDKFKDDMAHWQTYTFNTGAPWNDVKKIYIRVFGAFGLHNGCGLGYFSEIRAFGPAAAIPGFQDIGLRVRNGSGVTVSIAAEIGVATSPLRIAKGGVVYGIALVDPGDPNDSGVRIQTANDGLKALRRL